MGTNTEIAEIIFERIRPGNNLLDSDFFDRLLGSEKTEKQRLTKTPLLISTGSKLGKLLSKEGWCFDGLEALWTLHKRETQLIAIGALGVIAEKDHEHTKRFVLNKLDDIHDWEICDQMALRVVVKLVIQEPKDFLLLEQWVNSGKKWIIRLAVATIPPYIRAKKSESKTCLGLLSNAMQAQDREVKKAVAWALREVSKKSPDNVFNFLKTWSRTGVDDKNTKWIIKEGMKKLSSQEQRVLKKLTGL